MTDSDFQLAGATGWVYPRSDTVSPSSDKSDDDARGSCEASTDAVSAQEISEIVAVALQDAMLAASKPCPKTYLGVVERQRRDRIVERLNGLPPVQMAHPVVQAEVFKELAMMRVQSKLANGIVKGIREYGRSKRRAVICAMR